MALISVAVDWRRLGSKRAPLESGGAGSPFVLLLSELRGKLRVTLILCDEELAGCSLAGAISKKPRCLFHRRTNLYWDDSRG